MGIVSGALLVLLGILGASSVIFEKNPEARALFAKIAKYQGYISVAGCLWGIWTIISSFLNLGWLSDYPIWWVTYLATGIVETLLGFILGYGLIQKYVLSTASEDMNARAEETHKKLIGLQVPLGWAGIGLGLWCIVAHFMLLA